MKYEVYWNRRSKTWSIRLRGVVVGHSPLLFLWDAQFIVSKAGQRRVRETKQRNVHAVIRAHLIASMDANTPMYTPFTPPLWALVHYNPYIHDTFVYGTLDPVPVEEAAVVILTPEGRCYATISQGCNPALSE